ncbi:unnamed protein product [Ectocarpus sp. 8 AP-2014]
MPTRISYIDLKMSLGDGILEAEKMFEGEPEKSLVAAILWAFDVPSEAFRLGATRVFFRAGQISVLHKILNETPTEKIPWVLSRLRLALANRRMARIAAEEAEDVLAEAEAAVMEAEAVSSAGTGRPVEKNNRPPMSPGASADEDIKALVATVDKARRAAQNTSQVKSVVKASVAEGVGQKAVGADEKVKKASEEALADIAKATQRANELEGLTNLGTTMADGATGETSAVRELHTALRDVREGLAKSRKLWKSSEEAADKCEGSTAVETAKQSKDVAADVIEKSKVVSETSKRAIEIARKQRRAKEATTRATEKALRTFRTFQVTARQATLDEKRARENMPAADGNKKSLSSLVPSAATPGRGLTAAALAMAAGAPGSGGGAAAAGAGAAAAVEEKYENLTDGQKEVRAVGQKAAVAEAATAIAELSKEEEQKRLELAALEEERLQELQEEAAATTSGAVAATATADGGVESAEQDAKLQQVANALKKVQEAEGDAGASAGTVGRLDRGKKPGAALAGAAAAAAEAGTRSRGPSKAAAGGSAAAVAMAGEGGEGEGVGVAGSSPTRKVQTTGWGENDSQNGPGSVKDRLGAFSPSGRAAGSSSALAASQGDIVATAPGSGAEGVEAGAPTAEAFPADQGFGADKKSAVGTEAAAATGRRPVPSKRAAGGCRQAGGARRATGQARGRSRSVWEPSFPAAARTALRKEKRPPPPPPLPRGTKRAAAVADRRREAASTTRCRTCLRSSRRAVPERRRGPRGT